MNEKDKEWILKLVELIDSKLSQQSKEIIVDINITGSLELGTALQYIKATVKSSK